MISHFLQYVSLDIDASAARVSSQLGSVCWQRVLNHGDVSGAGVSAHKHLTERVSRSFTLILEQCASITVASRDCCVYGVQNENSAENSVASRRKVLDARVPNLASSLILYSPGINLRRSSLERLNPFLHRCIIDPGLFVKFSTATLHSNIGLLYFSSRPIVNASLRTGPLVVFESLRQLSSCLLYKTVDVGPQVLCCSRRSVE